MEKVVLLKTQLAEAVKYAKMDDFRFQRIAVILLDNFVEIQLKGLIKEKFLWDGNLIMQEKKYSEKHRERILNNYVELLKTSEKENFINTKERFLLAFCHNVRNNLYHNIGEEILLVKVAIQILHSIILEKQPKWKSAKGFTTITIKTNDPYRRKTEKLSHLFGNSDKDWIYFLEKYFNILDKRKSTISKLLYYNMIQKLRNIRYNYRFIKNEYTHFFPYAVGWEFNDYLLHYSFKIQNHIKLEIIKENKSIDYRKKEFNNEFTKFQTKWHYKKYNRLREIEKKAKELSHLDMYGSLEKYLSLREELNLIHDSIGKAASELDESIQLAIDIARGK